MEIEKIREKVKSVKIQMLGFAVFFLAVAIYPIIPFLIFSPIAIIIAMYVFYLVFGIYRIICPQCGEYFFKKGFMNELLTSKCLHCGLKVGE